jgi:hypothetical protein
MLSLLNMRNFDNCRMVMINGLAGFKICSFFSPLLSLSMFSSNTFITSSQGARHFLSVFCPDFLQKKVLTWLPLSLLAFLFFYLPCNIFFVIVSFSIIPYHGFLLCHCLFILPFSFQHVLIHVFFFTSINSRI